MNSPPFSFVAHKGSTQRVDTIAEFLSFWRNAGPPGAVAASVFLPDNVPATVTAYVDRLRAFGDLVVADPAMHYREFAPAQRGRGRGRLAYMSSVDPYANPETFVASVLDAQVNAHGSVLVAPGLTLGRGALDESMEVSAQLAHEAAQRAANEGMPFLIGQVVTPSTVTESRQRNDILNALVDDYPPGDVYLRLFVKDGESFRQYADEGVLEGLAEVATSLAANGRALILPQLGLAGWLLMARGATGFGAGMSSTLQMCSERSAGQRGRTPLPRYFLPSLLCFVFREELAIMRRQSLIADCSCPFCQRLLPTAEAEWSTELAGQHYLWWRGVLAGEAQASATPRQVVADRVEGAQAFYQALRAAGVSLDPRSEPRHLAAWSRVVQ